MAALCAGAVLIGAAACTGGGGEEPETESTTAPVGWQAGEIKPAVVKGACGHLSRDTFALLDLEPPKNECGGGTGWPKNSARSLTVRIHAEEPDPYERVTATEAATALLPQWSNIHDEDLHAVPGLAEEAYTARTDRWSYDLILRHRNLLVEVGASVGPSSDLYAHRAPPRPDVEAAVLSATEEILTAVGIPPDRLPEAPDRAAGEVERPKPLCEALRADAKRLVGDIEPVEKFPAGGDASYCNWGGPIDASMDYYLVARVEARAPSALSGRTGVEEADRELADDPAGDYEVLAGLGDEALVTADASALYVRADNLLVTLRYSDDDFARAELLAALQAMARTVLAQYA